MFRKRKKKENMFEKGSVYSSLMYSELPEYIFIFIQATDFTFIFSFLWDCATCFDVDLDVFNFFDILFANS